MSVVKAAQISLSLSGMLAPLRQQFDSKQYAKCLAGLEALAEQGDSEAAIMVSHIYFYGGRGVRKNFVRARHWLELISEDGYQSYAGYKLGIIYYKGLGVASDKRAAYQALRASSLKGNRKSLVLVGWQQRTGDGVLKKRRSGKVILLHCVRDKSLNNAMRALAFVILFF